MSHSLAKINRLLPVEKLCPWVHNVPFALSRPGRRGGVDPNAKTTEAEADDGGKNKTESFYKEHVGRNKISGNMKNTGTRRSMG